MFTLNFKGKLISFEKPLVMGILNLTNDSFYEGSRLFHFDEMAKKAAQMVKEGVDILDIGAQSTRPGSQRISANEELKKLLPVIGFLQNEFPKTFISVDTYHSKVAEQSIAAGAALINDISGGEMDKNMILTVAKLQVPYICMHMKGKPETMQDHTQYENVTLEILDYFIDKVNECRKAGIKDIIIDPGFGFAKNIQQNFLLLKNLSSFKMLGTAILAGISRKSTIYKTLHTSAEEALNGTTVLNTIALQNGANILRVHDVKEAKETIALLQAYGEA